MGGVRVNKNITHLHLHTEYSLLDGVGKIDEYLERCKELGMNSIGITDHGNMFGAIEFYKAAIKKGIKPVIGIETYLGEKSDTEKRKSTHLILLAKNNQGYKNLLKISSYGYIEGFYHKPRVSKEFLESHSNGVIALSACMAGEIPKGIIEKKNESEIDEIIKWYKYVFKDDFYIEIQGNGLKNQKILNLELIYYAKKHNLKVVATNDTHYVRKGEHKLQDVLICIQTGSKLQDSKRMKIETEELFLKSREELYESLIFNEMDIDNWSIEYNRDLKEISRGYFSFEEDRKEIINSLKNELNKIIAESLEITNKIAASVGVHIEFGEFKFPNYKVPEEFNTVEEYLEELVLNGLKKRIGGPIPKEYSERVKFELEVINKTGYAGYFVVVWDFIAYGRSKGIIIGPGRGSAAGSLVSYALEITDLDPIEYKLIFERFLNPERISMPDIDIDICAERRQEIIDYVVRKYGEEHVAQIITFGRMKARAAVRDVGRVMDVSLGKIDKLAKLLPHDRGIKDSINTMEEIKKIYVEDQEIQKVLDYGARLENTVRHASIHAAGIVITGAPLTDDIPLYVDSKDKVVSTQYQMKELEELGILKMDFLGLRNLTILQKIQRAIENSKGIKYQLEKINLSDKKTYELISKGDTTGVFQLESQGMRKLIRRLKPDRFQDIIALLALYRPGPLGSGMVENFINCKNGLEKIKYPDPSLSEILSETYGVILYQEQVMKIATKMANYTLGESDNLRRAMGKKNEELMSRNREIFVSRAVINGYTNDRSEYIYDLIEKFAGYGFNKSHSASYALIAFWTAYFKANYPMEFYVGILSTMSDVDDLAYYVEDAKLHNIKIEISNINDPLINFKIDKNKIKYSLMGIKGVGESFIKNLVFEFEKNGEFTSYEDFAKRMRKSGLNKKNMYSLISAGALDNLPGNRKEKNESIDKLLEYVDRVLKEDEIQQMNLFGTGRGVLNRFNFPIKEDYTLMERLDLEKEVLGFYLSAHPLDEYKKIIKALQLRDISDILEEKTVHHVKTYGIIEELRKIITKKDGNLMGTFNIRGYLGVIDGVIFPREYNKYFQFLHQGAVVVIKGEVQIDVFQDQERTKLIVKEIIPFNELENIKYATCDMLLDFGNTENLNELKKIIYLHTGNTKLNLWNTKDRGRVVESKQKISLSKKFIEEVMEILGEDNIKIRI